MTEKVQSWNEKIIDEFRANDGDVITANFGRSLILLHHTGAKSGQTRTNPLRALHDGDDTWFVVASAQGSDTHPDWFHNLVAHPRVQIETPDDGTVSVTAELLAGADRELAWLEFTEAHPGFLQYQQETLRQFPVIALRRHT